MHIYIVVRNAFTVACSSEFCY